GSGRGTCWRALPPPPAGPAGLPRSRPAPSWRCTGRMGSSPTRRATLPPRWSGITACGSCGWAARRRARGRSATRCGSSWWGTGRRSTWCRAKSERDGPHPHPAPAGCSRSWGVHAEVGGILLRRAQEPHPVRPGMVVQNRHLTTRYLVRRHSVALTATPTSQKQPLLSFDGENQLLVFVKPFAVGLEQAAAVREQPIPNNVHQLQRFVVIAHADDDCPFRRVERCEDLRFRVSNFRPAFRLDAIAKIGHFLLEDPVTGLRNLDLRERDSVVIQLPGVETEFAVEAAKCRGKGFECQRRCLGVEETHPVTHGCFPLRYARTGSW